jgi:hypothetical protein
MSLASPEPDYSVGRYLIRHREISRALILWLPKLTCNLDFQLSSSRLVRGLQGEDMVRKGGRFILHRLREAPGGEGGGIANA